MDISGGVTNETKRARTVLALTLVAVVAASVAVGTVSAATLPSLGSADPVEIGQSDVSQTVTFDIELGPSETTTVRIITGLANGLGSREASVSSVSSATSSNGLVTAGPTDLSNGVVTFTLEETDGTTQTTTVTVDLTVDASSQTTETIAQYTIEETNGGDETMASFDLEDTIAPTFDSAITGDSTSGSSTERRNITLSFGEDGSGIDPATVDASDFSVDTGQTVTSATLTAPDEIMLGVDSDVATDATPKVTLGADGISDNASNPRSSEFIYGTDGLAPQQTGWAYDDGDGDGTVDLIRVDFSEDIDEGSLSAGDWTVTDPGDPNLANPTTPNLVGGDRLYLNVTADADATGTQTGTVDTPRVQYSGTSVVDAAGYEAPTQTEGYKDVADPAVKSAESLDPDGDGQVDRIDVTFTEQISAGQSSDADADDFTIGGTDADSVTIGDLTVPGDGPTVELAVTGPADDTELSLTLDYDATTIRRDGSNIANTFSGETVGDGAAPVVTSATTLDRDGDGKVDAATLTFTEALSDTTVDASDFSIGGQAADSFDTLSTADDDTLQVRITTDADEVSGTDSTDVTHSAGTTADAAGNTLGTVGSGDVTESDGAAPVVSDFSLTADDANDELDVSFGASESLSTVSVSLSGPESATLSSFTASGSTYTASARVSTTGGYTATLDTADDAAGNSVSTTPSDTATVSFVATATPTPASRSNRDRGNNAPSALSETSSKARLSGSTGLSEVGVRFDGSVAGTVRVTEVRSLVANTPPGTFVSAVDITVPGSLTRTSSTVKFALSRDRLAALGVDASSLTVYRLHDGSWHALETRVLDRGDDTIVVEADTPGFSRFAVMAGEPFGSTSTATSTATASGSGSDDGAEDASEPSSGDGSASGTGSASGDGTEATSTQVDDGRANGTETSTQTPGFGVGAALVAVLTVAAVGFRRRD